jgi:hypothetical protein
VGDSAQNRFVVFAAALRILVTIRNRMPIHRTRMNLVAQFRAGALRNAPFDACFVLGIPAVALAAGGFVTLRPELFLLIFSIDMWLLGYHHVVATFTRVCFDSESFKTHRWLVLLLPLAVAAAVLLAVTLVGMWAIATVYLYWQWWHYTRQSEGISKAYAAKNSGADVGDRRLARIVHYALPTAGILTVSARGPSVFVFLPVKVLPVPMEVAQFAQIFALIVTVAWLYEQFRIWRSGRLAVSYSAYMATHLLIYAVAYIGFEDATRGWLVINTWHNLQYLAFVWLYNNRRFSTGVDSRHAVLSTLSQTKNWWLYALACLTISTVFYSSIETVLTWTGISSVAYLAALYQSINFHHYIVDSQVWKLRRPSVRQTIGLA